MFGRKKKLFREEALKVMFLWVPSINERDLKLFGVLMKFHFDRLFAADAQPHEAAFSIGSLYFLEVVRCAKERDEEFFKHMTIYSGWLGACADHILNKTDFLTDENRLEIASALEEANSLVLPSEETRTLGELINIEKLKASTMKSGVKKINEARGIV